MLTSFLICNQPAGVNGVVGDVTSTPPFIGKGKKQRWGQYLPRALGDRVNTKNGKYFTDHRRQDFLFLPLVASTYAQVNADSAILCHILGHKAAEEYYNLRGWTTSTAKGLVPGFLRYRSRLVLRYKARIARSVCFAAGARGLIGATPTPWIMDDAVRVTDIDYGEDLPHGPNRAPAA